MATERDSLLGHTGIYLLARGLPGVMAFFAIPVFTRMLSPSDYGRYAILVSFTGLLNAFLFQWLRLSLIRYLPAYGDQSDPLKSTLITMALAITAAAWTLGATASLIPYFAPWRLTIFACCALLGVQALFELFLEYARARMQPWRYSSMMFTKTAVSIATGAVLIQAGFGWRGPIIGLSIGMFLPALSAFRRDWTTVHIRVNRDVLGTLFHYGIPLSITVALTVIINSSDRLLIAWLLGDDAAGTYSAGVDVITQTLTLLMMTINLAAFPLAVRALNSGGPEAARAQLRNNASLLLGVGVPATVGLCILAPGIADCLLGPQFRDAASKLIPIVSISGFLAGIKAYYFDAAFQFVGRTLSQVWIVLAVAIVNAFLNLVMIRRFHLPGAATATLCAYALSMVLTIWQGRRKFRLPFPWITFFQVLVAAAAMAGTVYPTRSYRGAISLTFQVAIGACIYGISLFTMNFLKVRSTVIDKLFSRRKSSLPTDVIPTREPSEHPMVASANTPCGDS